MLNKEEKAACEYWIPDGVRRLMLSPRTASPWSEWKSSETRPAPVCSLPRSTAMMRLKMPMTTKRKITFAYKWTARFMISPAVRIAFLKGHIIFVVHHQYWMRITNGLELNSQFFFKIFNVPRHLLIYNSDPRNNTQNHKLLWTKSNNYLFKHRCCAKGPYRVA